MSAELAHARALLSRVRLIDGHNDMPFVIWSDKTARGDVKTWDANRIHPETDTDLPRLKAGLVSTQVMTAFIPTMIADPLRVRLEVIDVMLQLEQLYPQLVHPVLCPDDLIKAQSSGKIGQLKAVEGLVGVDKVGHLRLFYAMGIRLITLCHNETLPFIDSATDRAGETPLSAFGEEIIAEMERLGLIVDLAHVSPAAQLRVLEVASGPCIISHANARALCGHPRNAPDEVVKRLADKGGIIMPTFVPSFLGKAMFDISKRINDAHGKMRQDASADDLQAALSDIRQAFSRDGIELIGDHLDHLRNLVGIEALGIGSDFYGGPNPPGLEDATCFPALFAGLMKRGWHESDLEKLAGGNFERVWRSVYRG